MTGVEEWAEIRRRYRADRQSIRAIARELGLSRNTVRAALRGDTPPRYVREARGSIVDAVEDDVRRLLLGCPTMPVTVIAERIAWSRGLSVLRKRVRELRPVYQPIEPYQRTEYVPGELAQWDIWFPAVRIPVGHRQTRILPVWVGVSGYSRWIVARMIPSREAHDILAAHWACLRALGGVPRLGVYDQEGAIGQHRGGRPEWSYAFSAFRGVLGMGAHLLRANHPEGKGGVERVNGYFETSFLPGREFDSPQDFNLQLGTWLEERANRRVHAALRVRPCERIEADRQAMLSLPPVVPDTAWHKTVRLGRDHYVRFGTCDYSVHPRAIGWRVEIEADLEQVVVRRGAEEVARHPRCWAQHQTITDPAHVAARRELVRVEAPRDPWSEVEQRDLGVYDQLGVLQ